jgi:cytochrome c biogenesis protein CcmG/thiol:disulfide interchange protein DsbE
MKERPMQSEATATPVPAPGEGVARRRFLFALPAAAFAGLAGLFAMSLGHDPSRVPSALIGRPAPEFSLPPVQGRTLGLSIYGVLDLTREGRGDSAAYPNLQY